jgi:hypothetical protein
MDDPNPPTTLAAIDAFERERKLVLPQAYKKFLLATNGGVPNTPIFPIKGMELNPFGGVQSFLGIDAPLSDLAENNDLYAGGIPANIVLIAGNGGGDYICLDLRDGGEKVVFWDKRPFWGAGEWRESDLYPVANSFEEFLASLRPIEDLEPFLPPP